ncbi:MAG: hypothetical protein IJ608_09085 [Lachnospiraceae bacterium]|nr:hypothetical protein [Lachnospiraceae bacterium]
MKLKFYLRGLGIGIFVTALIMHTVVSDKGKLSDDDIVARAEGLGMVMAEENPSSLGDLMDPEVNGTPSGTPEISEATAAPELTPLAAPAESTESTETAIPTPSPTATATATPSPSPTATATATATPSPTATATATPTPSPTATATATPSPSPTATATPTPSPTATATPSPKPTATAKPTATPTSAAANTVKFTIEGGSGSYTVARNLAEAGLVENAGDFDTYLCEGGYDRRISTGTFEISKNASYEEIARIITRQR